LGVTRAYCDPFALSFISQPTIIDPTDLSCKFSRTSTVSSPFSGSSMGNGEGIHVPYFLNFSLCAPVFEFQILEVRSVFFRLGAQRQRLGLDLGLLSFCFFFYLLRLYDLCLGGNVLYYVICLFPDLSLEFPPFHQNRIFTSSSR
jgi:hypothetical protein